jgi:hypothetical protein
MSEITPGDLIRSSWLDDEPTPAPEGEAWTEDAELERRQTDYERGFRDGRAASPVVPVGVSREEIADILRPMVRSVAANSTFTAEEREDYLRRKTDAILAALRPTDTGANHD